MKQNNTPSIRKALEQMPTEQLDEILDRELHNENVDGDAIRLILNVLKDREKDYPAEITPAIEEAWEKYRQDTAKINKKAGGPRRVGSWPLRVASMAALLLLLVSAIPQKAEAEILWERLVRWTDSVFDFFSTNKEIILEEYEFQTDNPGLQQVYDAVTELGVTFPVVPMWLPEGYKLMECEINDVPGKKYVSSKFSDGDSEIIYQVNIYNSNAPVQYQKDKEQVKQVELHGTTYYIMRNIEEWTVTWSKENTECFITIDCQEETVNRVLKSIYTVGEDA